MFEDIIANIKLLEKNEKISVEQIISSMCRLYDNAGGKKLAVADTEEYGYALIKLISRIQPSFLSEKEKLLKLSDEDVSEAVEMNQNMENELSDVRSEIEKLGQEKEKLLIIKAQYDEEKQIQDRLLNELGGLRNISVEDVKAENEKLEREIEARKKNEIDLATAEEKLINIRTENSALSEKKEELLKTKAEAEKEEAELRQSVYGYKQWKADHGERMAALKSTADESEAVFTVIRNAWNSLKEQSDLSELLKEDNNDAAGSDIKSYAEIKEKMQTMEEAIEKALSAYAEMYKGILEAVDKKR